MSKGKEKEEPAGDAYDESAKETVQIGLIGMGDMGRLYATRFRKAGWKNINVCDVPSKYEQLKKDFEGTGIEVLQDGHLVSRRSDVIFYSVEAKNIDAVVEAYGPSTKLNAVVGGQTSVKEPEIKAFEKHLPPDVAIVTCHSLHGPNVDTTGQPLVLIRHRSDDARFRTVKHILSCLHSDFVCLPSYLDHDRITADTQAVTHLAFLSMVHTWRVMGTFPWENPSYVGGIENVKILISLRIISAKWHVYAGLAMMNPSARKQIRQYAQSATHLYKLMVTEQRDEFERRIRTAGEAIFGGRTEPFLLSDDLLEQFSLSAIPKDARTPNSHLSLLAMADCWYLTGANPYDHMICQTPIFRILLGITEYVFRTPALLTDAINAALQFRSIRADDLEFCIAAQGWVQIIESGDQEGYRQRFEGAAEFFGERLNEANRVSGEMIRLLMTKTHAG
ncbi:hypothetical protein DFJ74DRAFT_665283 [Hyaloraphidium curvatum]|nr:hypothetical protein DFJ74DRAFT_665283 [Hyaloraphidium curvatum]